MNTLRTGVLVLEPQTAAHAAEMFELLADPAIYEFENAPPESLAWLERRFARLEARVSPDGAQQWLNWVVRLPSRELAGYVQATIGRDGVAELAYVLGSAFWGRGIGGAALRAMLAELAETCGVHTAVATFKTQNYRSAALLRSLHFSTELPRGLAVAHAQDETVMYKRLGADGG